MSTVNFKLAKGKSDTTKVYIRFRESGIDIEIPTHLSVQRSHWNQNKQEIRKVADSDEERAEVNEELATIRDKVTKAFNRIGDTIPDKVWLKDILAEHQGKQKSTTPTQHVYLTDFGKQYADDSKFRLNSRTNEPIDQRTIYDFYNTVNKLVAFEKHSKKRVKLTEVDIIFHRNFMKYLREVEFLGANTIGGQIDNVKAFMREATILNIPVHNAYLSKHFSSPSAKTMDPYLNVQELALINDHFFEFDGFKDNARDWLIISCWTGLRVSDLLDLKNSDIIKSFIDITNKKTGIDVAIPLHPMVRKILAKRGGQFPRELTDQKYNDYIKTVCKEVGLTDMIKGAKMQKVGVDANGVNIHRKVAGTYPKYELVTSHIGRRSFATNHYGKLDTLTIMRITGHQTEKQFLQYVKITPKEHAQRLAQKWLELYEAA